MRGGWSPRLREVVPLGRRWGDEAVGKWCRSRRSDVHFLRSRAGASAGVSAETRGRKDASVALHLRK